MHLAMIRIGSTVIASFLYRTLDEAAGAHVYDVVSRAVRDGAGRVVVDFNHDVAITTAGVRWLRDAARELPDGTTLAVSGLGRKAEAPLRSLVVSGALSTHDGWPLAVAPARAA
jgi:hypothetical protein